MAVTAKQLYGKNIKNLTRHPNQFIKIYSLDFDSSYPTGGEDVSAVIDEPIVDMWWISGGTRRYYYDKDAGKIIAQQVNTTTGVFEEEADMTNLATETGIKFAVLVDQI